MEFSVQVTITAAVSYDRRARTKLMRVPFSIDCTRALILVNLLRIICIVYI